jgi:hypothetical protein
VLILTVPKGMTLTAETDVELADKWGQLEHGDDWQSAPPFAEHTAMWAFLEALAEIRENPALHQTLGYTLTTTESETGL